VPVDAVAVTPPMTARSELLERLGAAVEPDPSGLATRVSVDALGATSVPGVWATGNAAEPMATVVMAAAGGARVAGAIHADLLADDVDAAVRASGAHEPAPAMDEAWWDERYRQKSTIWSGDPNPVLVTEVEALRPGRALEVGAGEGGDAIWLADRGWSVTAVDISQVALERAQAAAQAAGTDVAGRIEWCHADVLEWSPSAATFDLVTVHYLHLPPEQRRDVYARLAAGVVAGGVLLVVAHHPSDMATGAGRPRHLDMFFTAEELQRDLVGDWHVLACDARPRRARDPEGNEITVHDTVLVARRG
jgi:SAM-dependent methyltransferase